MSKTRMNATIRTHLMKMVEQRVTLNDEAAKLNDLLLAMGQAIRIACEVTNEDYKILRKYGHGNETVYWYVSNADGETARPYTVRDDGRILPVYGSFTLNYPIRSKSSNEYGRCEDDTAFEAAVVYTKAQYEYLTKLHALKVQYEQFIKSYKYYEDLCEDWPEAKEVESLVRFNSPVPVEADFMRVVREDLKRRGVK